MFNHCAFEKPNTNLKLDKHVIRGHYFSKLTNSLGGNLKKSLMSLKYKVNKFTPMESVKRTKSHCKAIMTSLKWAGYHNTKQTIHAKTDAIKTTLHFTFLSNKIKKDFTYDVLTVVFANKGRLLHF